MATNIVFNGTTYSIPAEGDTFGDALSSYLIAIASATLQKSGGSFALTNELNFGASYGLKLSYIKSQATNPASSGVLRLGNTDAIKFRNAANTSDLSLSLSTDSIQFNSINLVDVSSTQTLTNKTLTSPAITTPTGIVKADVGLSNVDNTSDATKNAATATLTNKTISGASNTLSDVGYSSLVLSNSVANADISASAAIAYSKLNLASSIVNADINASAAIEMSKLETLAAEKLVVTNPSGQITTIATTAIQAGYLNGVTSAIQTQLDAKATSASLSSHASATSTHGVSGNIVGTTDFQSLTNKDIDGGTASNSSRITIPKNTLTNLQALTRKQGTIVFDTTANKPYYDDGSNLKVIGSGAGGAINFIADGDAEAAQILTGYTSSSVGTRPAGTQSAGASNLTLSQTTSSPLSGSQSFLITKAASNSQGQNASIPFSVDLAYRAKAVTISFDYLVNSGTFQAGSNFGTVQDSDIIVYIYDVTNSTYIEPSSIRLLSNSTTLADKFQATFQTSATGSSYRLILHVATTSASAWAVKCENFSVGPSQYVYGTPATDWQSYTPTISASSGTLTNYTLSKTEYARVGENIYIRGRLSFTGAVGTWSTPIITLPNGMSSKTNGPLAGEIQLNDSGASFYRGVSIVGVSYNQIVLYAMNSTSGGYGSLTQATPFSWASPDYIEWTIGPIQIAGLSSSVQMSDSADTRIVDFTGTPVSTALTANVTNIPLTASKDSHGAWSTNQYIVPISGDYQVSAVAVNSVGAGTLMVYVDGSLHKAMTNLSTSGWASASLIIPNLRAGQTISFREDVATTISGSASGVFSISRISGPSAVAATESISASYTTSSQSVAASTDTAVLFGTKLWDSHNSFNTSTGVYTIPASGKFHVDATTVFTSYTGAGNTAMIIYKNGVAYKQGSYTVTHAVSGAWSQSISCAVDCIAGDQITIRVFQSSGSSRTLNGTSSGNHFNIARIGL